VSVKKDAKGVYTVRVGQEIQDACDVQLVPSAKINHLGPCCDVRYGQPPMCTISHGFMEIALVADTAVSIKSGSEIQG